MRPGSVHPGGHSALHRRDRPRHDACVGSLACPVCDGQAGHPILISCGLIDALLKDSGEDGLRGALSRLSVPMVQVPVSDAGVLHDADTPDDYHELLKYHNRQLIRPVVRLSFAKETEFFDENIAMLLTLVKETNSVRSACQRMQISYSSGWNALRRLESQRACRSCTARRAVPTAVTAN